MASAIACTAAISISASASGAPRSVGHAVAGPADAKALVAKYLKRPTSIGPLPTLRARIPAGKTIVYMECGVASCVPPGNYLAEAARALGWKVKRIQVGLTPESIKAGWGQVANMKPRPAGVVGVGFGRVIFAAELAKLAKLGIPVVNQSVTEASGAGEVVVNGNTRVTQVGRVQADYVTADSNGKANTLLVISHSFPIQTAVEKGFKQEYARVCPGCKVDTMEAPLSSLGTTLSTTVVGYLRSHPDVNYVVYGLDNALEGLPQNLAGAGLAGKVKLVGEAPGAATMQYIAAGQQRATVAFPWPEVAWRSVGVFAQVATGHGLKSRAVKLTADAPWPQFIITKQNLPAGSKSGYFPLVRNYRAQFLKLWPNRAAK
jgi:ribose transport system substrate-binding protein